MARKKKERAEAEPVEAAEGPGTAGDLGGALAALTTAADLAARLDALDARMAALEERVRTHFRDHHKFVEAVWK